MYELSFASASRYELGNKSSRVGVKTNKMKGVTFLVEKKRYVSQDWLLGLTVGGYATLAVTLFCFGGGLFDSQMLAGNAQAFLLMIPAFFVGLLGFVQIHAEDFVKYKPYARITSIAVWLNVIPVLSFCALFFLKGVLNGLGSFILFFVMAVSFLLGIVVSLGHVLWILIAAKARIALVATLILCLLPAVWPAYRMGLFTRDAGRFATRQNRTIYLHPSDVSFQIPEEWLSWNAEFHNNFHLTHRELQKVRFGAGEWDYEYGEVVNAALPFEHCVAHVGGEGWGRQGVSFGDLQMRAYVTDLNSQEILKRISGAAVGTAQKLSRNFNAPGQVQSSVDEDGRWRRAVIRYSLFYGDYGGTANVEFYMRPVSHYQLVMVFMGSKDEEKQAILQSVRLPGPSELP